MNTEYSEKFATQSQRPPYATAPQGVQGTGQGVESGAGPLLEQNDLGAQLAAQAAGAPSAASGCVPVASRTPSSCGGPAYFSPLWTPFQGDRGRHFSVIVDGISG